MKQGTLNAPLVDDTSKETTVPSTCTHLQMSSKKIYDITQVCVTEGKHRE